MMAVVFAVVFVLQVDLEVGHVGGGAEKIVADEAVKIVGRGGAGVGLDVDDFGLMEGGAGESADCAGGLFERRAFGHVDDDLELAFVIEGEHLHFDKPDINKPAGGQQQEGDGGEERPTDEGPMDERVHPSAVTAVRLEVL